MGSITVMDKALEFFTLTLKNEPNLSPFFRLPAELRTEIYRFCFGEEVYSFVEAGCVFHISAGSHRDRERGQKLPTWLLASRQILREGTQCFYEHSVCWIWCKVNKADVTNGAASVLTLTRVPSLRLVAALSVIMVDKTVRMPDDQPAIGFHPYSAYTAYLRSVIDCSAAKMLHLQILKLRVNMPYSYSFHRLRYRTITRISAVDITTLTNLRSGLRRVEFVISEPQVDSTSENEVLSAEIAYTAIQQELEIVAKCLVSHEGRRPGFIARDWLEKKTVPGHRSSNAPEEAAGYDWHLEVSYLEGISRTAIRHKGMPSWEDVSGKDARYHTRKESPSGHVEWYNATYGKINIVVAKDMLVKPDCALPLHIKI